MEYGICDVVWLFVVWCSMFECMDESALLCVIVVSMVIVITIIKPQVNQLLRIIIETQLFIGDCHRAHDSKLASFFRLSSSAYVVPIKR